MISIITMTYNGEKWMNKCLDSFYKYKPIEDYEWIIMDAGSTNKITKDVVESYNDERLKYYFVEDANKSFSWVNNEASKYAKGEQLLFLNNDIEFVNDYSVKNMAIALEKYNAGCVGAKLLYPDGRVQHAGVIFRPNKLPWHMRSQSLSKEFLSKDRKYQAVTAACMLCNKEEFIKVRRFDERYYYCFEDVDLCLKMRHLFKNRKPSIYCGNTEIIHHESRTILALDNKKQKFLEAATLLRSKWGEEVEVDEVNYLKDANFNLC